jgi:hypothetical protein
VRHYSAFSVVAFFVVVLDLAAVEVALGLAAAVAFGFGAAFAWGLSSAAALGAAAARVAFLPIVSI